MTHHRKVTIGYLSIIAAVCGLIGIVAYYTQPDQVAQLPEGTPHVDVPVADAVGGDLQAVLFQNARAWYREP